MISFEKALEIIESVSLPLNTEKIPFMQSLHRVLAQAVISDTDMPPFNKAAMDGFACKRSDLLHELTIIEEIPAGKVPTKGIVSNCCARIMTGAMVPDGADFILMKEHAEITSGGKVRRITESDGANICLKGEDLKSGDPVLQPGQKLTAAHIAMLAATGCIHPLVYCLPRVAVISTGSELVEPEMLPETGKIRNSNGYQLTAQVMQNSLPVTYLGIFPDALEILEDILSTSLDQYEIIIISGGVSVGDYDYVPEALSRLGVEILFHGMHVKPGKHLLFGRKNNCHIVALPGNPVSSFVQFEVLVKPLLNRIMGMTIKNFALKMPLDITYARKKTEPLLLIPVSFSDTGTVIPLEYHGSAHIHSYAGAHGIMQVPAGVKEIKKGEAVHVRPL